MPDFLNKIDTEQLYRLLSNISDTCIIFFGDNMEVIHVIDPDMSLKEMIPGHEKLRHLKELPDPWWMEAIEPLCRNALVGIPDTRILMMESGQVRVNADRIMSRNGEIWGMLVLQGNTGYQKRYREEFKKGMENAEESSEVKSQFMASLSHEIRTPLNAIIGFIEQLQKTELDKKQSKYLNIIDKSSIYLLDLVNEILTYSKMEAGELSLDEVDFKLEPLFRDIYRSLGIRAGEKRINFSYHCDNNLRTIVRGDIFRLRQIVMNIVSNAIKFTEFGYVELKVEGVEETEKNVRIRITVSDTGIGIPADKMTEVFREYKQASSGITRLHGGTGLGLTISKRLTEMMNGSIQVESTVGKGSVFRVEIPLKRSPLRVLEKDLIKISTEILAGKSALMVDDDAMNRSLGEIILEGFNMKVRSASDGTEALEILQDNSYDIVLLDIHMPGISGIELAHRVRESRKNKGTRILAVTAEMVPEELEKYSEAGINDVLIKPYREVALYNKICKVLDLGSDENGQEISRIRLVELEEELVYNLQELRSVTKNNPEFFKEMIRTFISNARNGIDQIRDAYEKEDWKMIGETAHKLIPSYKHLEVRKVVSDLVEIKNRSDGRPDQQKLSRLITRIEKETDELIELLKKETINPPFDFEHFE